MVLSLIDEFSARLDHTFSDVLNPNFVGVKTAAVDFFAAMVEGARSQHPSEPAIAARMVAEFEPEFMRGLARLSTNFR